LAIGRCLLDDYQDIREIRGAMKYARMFETEKLFDNFRSQYIQYPYTSLIHTDLIYQLPIGYRELPKSYVYEGKTKKINEWNERTDTTGIIVIKEGKIIFENYNNGNDKLTHSSVFSVSKSFVFNKNCHNSLFCNIKPHSHPLNNPTFYFRRKSLRQTRL